MNLKKRIIKKSLRWLSGKVLKKYKPRVIGITGSVGKSTAKEMIFLAIKNNFYVRKNKKNYNNEIGIPLTIIGSDGEKKNLGQWCITFCKALGLIIFPNKYPEVLVLELAVDHPGDMKYFCDFIPVEVGVLTNIGISHLENFKSRKDLEREKKHLLQHSEKIQIYNKDSVNTEKGEFSEGISYGANTEDVDFKLIEAGYNYNKEGILSGMIFKIRHKKKINSGKLNNLIGRPYLYGVLAALSVAKYFNIEIHKILESLKDAAVIPGHMALLGGIKKTTIIDDTYNSAPASLAEALKVIAEVKSRRKIVVLGDMLELGSEEDAAHKIIGKQLAGWENVIFIAVGKRMKLAVREFKNELKQLSRDISMGDRHKVHWFKESVEAGRATQDLIKDGDLVLVKGSQGMRMEKIVVEIMAEPNRKKELIVRQDKNWV
jgi:UDP-N-acetylmuramoyl-tripeptide--D-alanyl-D-alanine ligase